MKLLPPLWKRSEPVEYLGNAWFNLKLSHLSTELNIVMARAKSENKSKSLVDDAAGDLV